MTNEQHPYPAPIEADPTPTPATPTVDIRSYNEQASPSNPEPIDEYMTKGFLTD